MNIFIYEIWWKLSDRMLIVGINGSFWYHHIRAGSFTQFGKESLVALEYFVMSIYWCFYSIQCCVCLAQVLHFVWYCLVRGIDFSGRLNKLITVTFLSFIESMNVVDLLAVNPTSCFGTRDEYWLWISTVVIHIVSLLSNVFVMQMSCFEIRAFVYYVLQGKRLKSPMDYSQLRLKWNIMKNV